MPVIRSLCNPLGFCAANGLLVRAHLVHKALYLVASLKLDVNIYSGAQSKEEAMLVVVVLSSKSFPRMWRTI